MKGYFLTIAEAKKDAQLKLEDLYKKATRVENFLTKNPNDLTIKKKLNRMRDYIDYLKEEINNFENIEKITRVN